jgi:hypothetical protein
MIVTTDKMTMYRFDAEQETLIKEALGKREELVCGRICGESCVKKRHENSARTGLNRWALPPIIRRL